MRRVLLGESHVTLAVRMASVRLCSAHSGVHLQGVCLPLFLHICNAARPVCALQPPRQQVDMQRQSFPSGTSLLCTAVHGKGSLWLKSLLATAALLCRYPGRKEENWWLLVGRPADNSCLVIKRVPLKQKQTTKLQFTAPEQTGQQELSLYFMCDSWNGCDQVCASMVANFYG